MMLFFFDSTLCALLNSFSFVWIERFHNEQIPSTHYLFFSVFFLFSSSTIAPSDQFWFHSNPAFTLLPNSVRRLSFTRLCSRSLAFTVSSHRALRYDLAVSCFLLTVLRHKMLLLRLPSDGSTTLCVRRFFSPPRYPTTHDVRSLLVVVFALAFDFFLYVAALS